MKQIILGGVVCFATIAANANVICTVNTYASPQGFSVGHIVDVVSVDLTKEQASLIVKTDGSVLKNVAYAEAIYENPSSKLGDVEGAVMINISRDQGAAQGVNVLMATLSNSQTIAKFEISSSSGNNETLVNNIAKGISVGCTQEKK